MQTVKSVLINDYHFKHDIYNTYCKHSMGISVYVCSVTFLICLIMKYWPLTLYKFPYSFLYELSSGFSSVTREGQSIIPI